MAKFPERLNGGMVSSQDPSTLQPGEVQIAQECMFYQDNEHLARVPGVTTWSTIASTSTINGLTACRFEDGTQKLVAQVSASGGDVAYYMADAETNNSTFATVVTGLTGGQTLTSVQYDNRHYLFNGVDDNLVLLKDGTVRPHGLKPAIAGGMSFLNIVNGISAGPTATGFYEYWYTEVLKFSDGQELESAFDGSPLTYELTSVTTAPKFRLPGVPANYTTAKKYNCTIHYNIYRSEKKTYQTDILYPVGRKCGEAAFTIGNLPNNDPNSAVPDVFFTDTSTVASTADANHTHQYSWADVALGGITVQHIAAPGYDAQDDYRTYTTINAYNANGTLSTNGVSHALNPNNTEYVQIDFNKGAAGWVDLTNGAWMSNINADQTRNGYYWATLSLMDFNFGPIDAGTISGIGVVVDASCNIDGAAELHVMPCNFDPQKGNPVDLPAPGGEDKQRKNGVQFCDDPNHYYGVSTFNSQGDYSGDGQGYRPAQNIFEQSKTIPGSMTAVGFGAANTNTTARAFLTGKYTWKVSDINDLFGVQVLVLFKNLYYSGLVANKPIVKINSVQMFVEFNAVTTRVTKDTKYYDAVTVEIAQAQSAYGANKPAKIASTGTIFSGSLVTNSKEDPNRIFYSVPGFPDYFPTDLYWFELPGVDNDKITYIGSINDRLVVGTRGSLWRINYLPSQDDASFARGQAVSLISNTVGIVNPTSACVFVNPQGQQELAFVDTNGVFSTDGYGIRKLSQDLLWVGPSNRAVFTSTSQTSPYTNVIGLINDARTQTLRLLTTAGGWIGSYAAIHVKDGGGLKWTKYSTNYAKYGVVNGVHVLGACSVKSATCIRRVNGTWIVVYGMGPRYGTYTTHGGLVAREDSSDSTTYNNPMAYANEVYPNVLTREISAAGLTNEFSVDGLAIHGTLKSSLTSNTFYNIGAAITASQRQTNASAVAAYGSIPGGVAGSRMAYAGIDGVNGDSTALTIVFDPLTDGDLWDKVAGMFEIHAIILDVNDFGEVDTSA